MYESYGVGGGKKPAGLVYSGGGCSLTVRLSLGSLLAIGLRVCHIPLDCNP